MLDYIKEILSWKSLVRELVIKDLKLRYARPVLGFIWLFLSPLFTVAVFYLIFYLVLKIKIEEAPFILYLMSAVFPWYFFQDSLILSTTSLIDNKHLIRESNFPHYLIPLSIVLANAINFLPSLFMLITISAITLRGIPLFIIFLPVILLMHLILTFGLCVIASVLYVRLRDVKYILNPLLLFLFYLTPAFYSIKLIKDSFTDFLFKLYIFNPFVGILNLYRCTIIKGFYSGVQKDLTYFSLIVIPALSSVAVLLAALYLYRKNKNSINDYLSY